MGWITVGVGVAALGTGVAFGVLAGNKSEEFDLAVSTGKTFGEMLEIDEEGTRYSTIQIATMTVGGVAAAAGAGLLLWHYLGRDAETSTGGTASLAPMISADQLGLSATVRF